MCVIFWACVGTYLDQVVPRELGIAKPWNFLCIFKKKRVHIDLNEEEKHRADLDKMGNFEKVGVSFKGKSSLKIRDLKM